MTTPPLTFDEYDAAAAVTAIYPESGTGSMTAVSYTVLGLASEAGEVAGKVKKIMRDQGGIISEKARLDLAAEVGDVLWYASRLAAELGHTTAELAAYNASKLASRAARGTLAGSGDNR